MKIYFISPDDTDLRMWCKEHPYDYFPTHFRIGYDNSYDLRSQYLSKPYISSNKEKLSKILDARRLKMIKDFYIKILQLIKIPSDVIMVGEYDAPF